MKTGVLFCAVVCAFLTACSGDDSQSSSESSATPAPAKRLAACTAADAASTALSKLSLNNATAVVTQGGKTTNLFADCATAEAKAGMVEQSIQDTALSLYAANVTAVGMHYQGDDASARHLLSMTSDQEQHYMDLAKSHGWSKAQELLLVDETMTSKAEDTL